MDLTLLSLRIKVFKCKFEFFFKTVTVIPAVVFPLLVGQNKVMPVVFRAQTLKQDQKKITERKQSVYLKLMTT